MKEALNISGYKAMLNFCNRIAEGEVIELGEQTVMFHDDGEITVAKLGLVTRDQDEFTSRIDLDNGFKNQEKEQGILLAALSGNIEEADIPMNFCLVDFLVTGKADRALLRMNKY